MQKQNKLLVDSFTEAHKEDALKNAIAAISNGNVLVATEASFMDTQWIRDQLPVVETMLQLGVMELHFFYDPDRFVSKDVIWSSFNGKVTPAACSIKDVCNKYFEPEDAAKILAVYEIAMKYGMPRGTWAEKAFTPVTVLTEEDAQLLELPLNANRSQILSACKEKGIDFNPYNQRYLAGFVNQHDGTTGIL